MRESISIDPALDVYIFLKAYLRITFIKHLIYEQNYCEEIFLLPKKKQKKGCRRNGTCRQGKLGMRLREMRHRYQPL